MSEKYSASFLKCLIQSFLLLGLIFNVSQNYSASRRRHEKPKNFRSGEGHLQHDGASMVSKHDPHFKKQIKETTYALLSLAAGDISKWYAHARHKLMIWTKENQTRLIYFSMMISRQNQKNTLCDFHRRVPPHCATQHTIHKMDYGFHNSSWKSIKSSCTTRADDSPNHGTKHFVPPCISVWWKSGLEITQGTYSMMARAW